MEFFQKNSIAQKCKLNKALQLNSSESTFSPGRRPGTWLVPNKVPSIYNHTIIQIYNSTHFSFLFHAQKDSREEMNNCYQHDIYYHGSGIAGSSDTLRGWPPFEEIRPSSSRPYGRPEDAAVCMKLCQERDGCEVFTYDRWLGHCYLKTALAVKKEHRLSLRGHQESSGVISGEMSCFKTPNTVALGSNRCYQTGKTYLFQQQPYQTLDLDSPADCRYACADREECSYFTQQNSKCYLWEKDVTPPKLDEVTYTTFTNDTNLPVSGDQNCFTGQDNFFPFFYNCRDCDHYLLFVCHRIWLLQGEKGHWWLQYEFVFPKRV